MPVAHLGAFAPTTVWKWANTDDAGLVAWLNAASWETSSDYAVDRTGVQPTLRWQQYTSVGGVWTPSGVWRAVPLTVGDYIVARHTGSSSPYEPGVDPMPGRWEGDQYGRPYNVNDIVAPPAPPPPVP